VPVLWVGTGNLWDRFELTKHLKKPGFAPQIHTAS